MNDQQLDHVLHLASLITKMRKGETLDETEVNELSQWENESEENKSLLKELLSDEQIQLQMDSLKQYDIEAAKKRIAEKLNIKQKSPAKIFQTQFRRIISAAAILILIATGGYLYYQYSNGRKATIETAKTIANDVAPGITGATLTLADGRKIALNKMTDGLLAKEQMASIVGKDGSIVYSESAGKGPVQYNTISTKRGEQIPVYLSDKTMILVDASTTIRFPVGFPGNERNVEIISGRAWFEVAKDASKPFFVNKGDKKVRVLGTHFDVSAYNDEPDMKVTLVEGSVQVTNGRETGMLKPGQQAVLSKVTNHIELIEDADIEQATAWKNGSISMHHADVPVLMREISRWYDVDVEIKGNLQKRDLYFSVSRYANLSELLKVFDNYHLHYQLDAANKKLTVTP